MIEREKTMEIINYKVLTEPNWEYELVCGIVEDTIKKESSDGQNANHDSMEINSILKNVMEYRDKVMNHVISILDQYPEIKPLFKISEVEVDNRARPILVYLVCQKKLNKELSEEDIDSLMLEGFEAWAKSVNGEYSDIRIANLSDLINFLKDLEVEDSVKMRMITLYSERYTLIPKVQLFLAEGITILKEYFHLVQQEFEDSVAIFQDKKFLQSNLDKLGLFKFGKCNSMILQPCIIPYNQIAVDWRDEEGDVVYTEVGLYVFRLSDHVKKNTLSDSKILSGLKALGDATRLKIIHMLTGKKMYIQEISDVLNLTPATVSHHINLLLQEGLVCVTVDVEKAKKIYYEINPEKYRELGEAVIQLGQ